MSTSNDVCGVAGLFIPSIESTEQFKLGPVVSKVEVKYRDIWNDSKHPEHDTPAVQQNLLEQYKIALEMADRVSARRGTANTFFLTFNTAVISAFGVILGEKGSTIPDGVTLTLSGVALVFCTAWAALLHSYRGLNTAKYEIIQRMEQRMPVALYSAEWKALGRGKVWSRYIPLSIIEITLPLAFAVAYCVLCTTIVQFDAAATPSSLSTGE